MGRHALLALLLFSLVVFEGSDAFSVRELRKLVASDPKDNKIQPTQDSPPPTENKEKLDPNPVGESKKKKENPPSTKNTTNSPTPTPQPSPKLVDGNGNQKGSNNTTPPASAPPPVPKKTDEGGKNHEEEKGRNGGLNLSQSTSNETCDGLNTCKDEGDMLACISKIDSKYWVVLLHNGGDGTIKVKLHSELESNLGDVVVDNNKTEKVNITRISSENNQLTLNAGKGDCVLHVVTRVPEANFFLRLPSYDKILTPVNGAYFLLLTVMVFGGTWACCVFRKKKQHDEVPYQELEMALPESAAASNVESAEGWDQVWDDDWDDDVAVKSPAAHLAGNISANGLTSRSANKDGWENSWDD